MLTVVSWWWKRPDGSDLFGPEYLRAMRSMLARHLHREHEYVVITDSPERVPAGIRTVRIPGFHDAPRCRRRMQQYDREFAGRLGTRILSIDLDMVLVDDITPLVDRREPLVMWKVGYAGVFSGSFVLYDYPALHGAWERFRDDPIGFPREAWPTGTGSDQAMINYHLRGQAVPHWTERDGIIAYFGKGYERFEKHGVGPNRPDLPDGTRVVVLGSDDKHVLDEGRHDWAREHWR